MPIVEPLEDRRLLSVSHVLTAVSPSLVVAPTPIKAPVGQGVTLNEQAGVPFTASVGTFVTIAPATNLHAIIRWGDGTSSKGTLKSDGVVGLDQIRFEVDGTHSYAKPGTFAIRVTVYQSRLPTATPARIIATINSTAIVAGKNVSLNGTITGKYSLAPTAADIGAGYVFNGTGMAGDLGQVSAHAFVTLPGFVASGQATGSMTLTSVTPLASAVLNSVTLSLTGPTEAGMGPFPSTLSYVITGGTGAFTGATGTGTIAVTINSNGTFVFVITSAPTPAYF